MKAALDWQLAMGLDEAVAEVTVDRFAVSAMDAEKKPESIASPEPRPEAGPDPIAVAKAVAGAVTDLDGLRAAMAAFEHCDLKRGARQLVFADGVAGARVMIVGEAPGREEDQAGRPFVGRAGRLLDLMFSHVGLRRDTPDTEAGLYITNVLPWRPPQNRDPKPDEVAMMQPFLEKHIELAAPELLVAMGNHATGALLGRTGITRLRGRWAEAFGVPVLPMFHPAYLLRNPVAKREAWADLLDLRAHLDRKTMHS